MFRRLLLIVTIVSLIAPSGPRAARRDRPGQSGPDDAHRVADAAALRGATGRVPDHPSDGAGAGQHGPLPDSDDPHHGTRPEPLGVRHDRGFRR